MSGEMKPACSVVLQDVWLFLDDEMDPDARAAVQRHLDDCSPCLEEAGLEEKLKVLLHSKCGGDLAPADLRERLVARLRTITAMTRTEEGETTSTTVTSIAVTSAAVTSATASSTTTLDGLRIGLGYPDPR